MLHKIQGSGQVECIDMVAQDFRYHCKCMDLYLNQRVPSKTSATKTPFERAFEKLITEIERGLFEEGHIYIEEQITYFLSELGVEKCRDIQKCKSCRTFDVLL